MSLTLLLLIVTVVFSAAAFENPVIFAQFQHHPFTEIRRKEYFRWLTSGFLHVDYLHLGVNMYVFYNFGGIVEQYYTTVFEGITGRVLYLLLYIGSIVAGALPSYLKHQNNENYIAVGASGGVAGIMFAFALLNPTSQIMMYGIKALSLYTIVWAVLYLVYEQWAGRRGQDNIGHDAHFWGAIFGFTASAIVIPNAMPHFISSIQVLINSFL
jgi:membrane associated rhomboid family serine protease